MVLFKIRIAHHRFGLTFSHPFSPIILYKCFLHAEMVDICACFTLQNGPFSQYVYISMSLCPFLAMFYKYILCVHVNITHDVIMYNDLLY